MHATSTFMSRLARDTRGNTIAIMAASLVPMLGLAGSAVDMSRLYVVKVRLQQACDAGVLAGRKFMTGTDATLDTVADAQARAFFRNNFQDGWMKTSNTQFTPAKANAAQVSGTARTQVPMTIMKFFGFPDKPLNVTCQARYDVADTDVLFVLDTTGSMACLPSQTDAQCTAYVNAAGNSTYTRPSDSSIQKSIAGYGGTTTYSVPENSSGSEVSRIEALRRAVLSFYDTFASVKDSSTRVRYGFVTYASSVNVGRAIMDVNSSFLVGSGGASDMPWYQSRRLYADYEINNANTYASATDTANGKTQANCTAPGTRSPATPLTYTNSIATKTNYDIYPTSGNGANKCYTRSTGTFGPRWEYKRLQHNVSSLLAGNTITDPTKVDGSTTRWLGCIETPVDTPGQATGFSVTSPPSEIDPDARPSGAQRWWPHMQDLEYERNNSYLNSADGYSNGESASNENYGSAARAKSGAIACGKPAKRIDSMSRNDVSNWLKAEDFAPLGGTYHDVGMIWGARLLSPTGPWAADTQPVSGRNLNRVIIFMTDGDMSPSASSYTMYGVEGYDRRVSGATFASADPGSGKNGDGTCTNTGANCYKYMTLHNNRFLAACASARAKNIDIFTIAIDNASSPQLTACATNASQAQFTTSGDTLKTLFEGIARKLAMLRLVPAP